MTRGVVKLTVTLFVNVATPPGYIGNVEL